MWVDSAHWAEAVWDRVGAAMWLDRGNEAQKSLFQSISRHLKFRVTFRPSYQGTHPLKESHSQQQKKKQSNTVLTQILPYSISME